MREPPDTTGRRLTDDEVTELALAFPDLVRARELLRASGFPMGQEPSWGVEAPLDFWREVNNRLEFGMLSDGRSRILSKARESVSSNIEDHRWLPRPPGSESARWKVGVGVMSVVVAVLAGVAIYLSGGTAQASSHLEVDDLVISQTAGPEFPSQATVTLHNSGSRRAVVTRAVLTVGSYASIPDCGRNGDIPVSGKYPVKLPKDPSRGQRIETPVSQQLAPDEADRFALLMSAPTDDAAYLYSLHLSVEYDSSHHRVDVGDFVVAVSYIPSEAGGAFWGREYPRSAGYFAYLGPTRQAQVVSCLNRNTDALRRFFGDSRAAASGLIVPAKLAELEADLGAAQR